MVNKATLDLLKEFEGVKLTVYLDPVKIPTVGVGHVVKPEDNLKVGDKITQEQVDAFLAKDLQNAEHDVEAIVVNGAGWKLSENERAALTSFAYNLGGGNLHQLIKLGRDATPNRILLFDRAGGKILAGLSRRRQAERKLFLTP